MQNRYPTYKYNETLDLLWDTFGTASFTAADLKERISPELHGPILRGLASRGHLAATNDSDLMRNGQTRKRYTIAPAGIIAIKRRRNERVPVCATRGERGAHSSVLHFFRHRCAHCARPIIKSRYHFVHLESGAMLPVCNDCTKLIRDGDPAYWNVCLENLIHTQHGGRWRLEGMDAIEKCDTAPPDQMGTV